MITLFENEDFILKSTGHNYDFVGIIENKNEKRLTFFFEETLFPTDEDDEDCEWEIDESETQLKGVFEGLIPDENNGYADEAEHKAYLLSATSWFTTRDDGSTGFLSDCKERGWFLALIKNYCPERLKDIDWT